MAKVSWLVPVYNAAPYLEASLESIRVQTYVDFEAIIVDDGSRDRSGAIIEDFCTKDSRFRAVEKSNSGIIDTLNVGLTYCRGEYVARMDADDICEPNRLAVQVAFMDGNPRCVAAGSRVIVIDEFDSVVRYSTPSVWRMPGPNGFPRRAVTLTHPTIIARTSALVRVGGYRHGFPAAEDYDLLFRLGQVGDLVEMPDHLLRYRVHSRSESTTKINQQRLSSLKAEIVDYLTGVNADESAAQAVISSKTVEELCRIAGGVGHGVPDADILRIYYVSEYLRRATYRLSRAEASIVAGETLRGLLKLLPRVPSGEARYFMRKAGTELLRWAAVTAIGRNRRRLAPEPVS